MRCAFYSMYTIGLFQLCWKLRNTQTKSTKRLVYNAACVIYPYTVDKFHPLPCSLLNWLVGNTVDRLFYPHLLVPCKQGLTVALLLQIAVFASNTFHKLQESTHITVNDKKTRGKRTWRSRLWLCWPLQEGRWELSREVVFISIIFFTRNNEKTKDNCLWLCCLAQFEWGESPEDVVFDYVVSFRKVLKGPEKFFKYVF